MSYRAADGGFGEGVSAHPPESYSLIDRHSSVEGTFTSQRDLRIEGKLRGTLQCQGLVYIAEGADIDATIEASHVTVAGNLKGTVTCRGKFQIMPTGRVHASISTESLVINEGAIFEGELQMDTGGAGATAKAASSAAEEGDTVPQLLRRFSAEAGDGIQQTSSPSTKPESDK